MTAQVRISLDLGGDSNTWVTVVPVRRSYPNRTTGVALAVGEAAAQLITFLLKDAEQVAERLADLERG